jgi:hypothetical protein
MPVRDRRKSFWHTGGRLRGNYPISSWPHALFARGFPNVVTICNAGDLHGKQTKEYDEAQGHIRIGIVIQDARSLPSPKMAVMNGTQTDRRSTRRLALRIPLRLSIWQSAGPEQRAESIDLSERGVLLVTDSALQIGTEVEVFLKIPKEVTGEPEIEWCCRGRVVRIVPDISFNGPVTAGVHFDWLQILRR